MTARAARRWIGTLAVVVILVSCGSHPGGGNGAPIDALMKDFSLALDPSTVAPGSVSFQITNDGPSIHEFEVIATPLAPDALPVRNSAVNTDGLDLVDEVEDIVPGTTVTLDVDLGAGSYVIICNIADHYEAGMRAAFTVRPTAA